MTEGKPAEGSAPIAVDTTKRPPTSLWPENEMNFSRPFTRPRGAAVGTSTGATGTSPTAPTPSLVKPRAPPIGTAIGGSVAPTAGRPGMTYGASNPAPPILTRPRAGASIINGQAPSAQVLAGAPGSGVGADAQGAADSITLGQMRANMPPPPAPRPKTQFFDYKYDDTDTIMNELDEFYPYVEMTQVAMNADRFKGSFDGDWTEASASKRKAYMEVQLEHLESSVGEKRWAAQGRLLYLLQGCFAETTSPAMQLFWIKENAWTLRSVDGVASLVLGLRDAAKRYNAASDAPERMASQQGSHLNSVDPYDDRSAEFMDLLAMLYFVIEVCRTDDTFGDELMAMSPPLPLVLFQMIAALKDRLPKGYPVKKVLLLLWKTLLACLGGMKEASKARTLSRELAGLPPSDKNFTKASPMDIASFRRDTSVKYPTFAPPSSSTIPVSNEKLAEGIRPLPPRANYHSTDLPNPRPAQTPMSIQAGAGAPPTSNPLPGTPAPTPPASPAPPIKPKRQQYQTDQTKPYIFPYSRSAGPGHPSYLVPFAIAEADNLYHRHSYVSLGLYQLWEAREDCLREERGLGVTGLIGFSRLAIGEEELDEAEEEQMRREWMFEEEEMEAERRGDKDGVRKARDRRQASRRLHRVDVIYKSTLPIMQSCVIVLLKLLLATVTGPGAIQNAANAPMPPAMASPTSEFPPPHDPTPPTREEVDISRHREITSKAVSGIIVLMLKWFRASHVLKFHYFAQLLFDSNCLLLVLKMFGLADVATAVQSKNEWDDWNFFQYCHLNCSKDHPAPRTVSTPPPRPKPRTLVSAFSSPTIIPAALPATGPSRQPFPGPGTTAQGPQAVQEYHNRQSQLQQQWQSQQVPAVDQPTMPLPTVGRAVDEEVEVISEYSWRNFFSTINFVKILQKMTKHRSHRTYMLHQYKSSQILKRMLRVNQPMLQLQVLKLIKSQMPWCGRKWRAGNMKVITAIYLNCRPELRDEWLAGQDQETELEDALPQETALRTLIQFYNKKHYPSIPSPQHAHPSPAEMGHRRTDSTSAVTLDDPSLPPSHQSHAPHPHGHIRSSSHGSSENDIFPPRRTDSASSLPYNPDGMIEFWLHEYEDVLGEVFGDGEGLGDWEDDLGFPPNSPRRPSYGSGFTSGGDDRSGSAEGQGQLPPRSPTSPRGNGEFDFGEEVPMPKAAERDDRAWNALGEIMGGGTGSGNAGREDDTISDTESVVTVGELGDEAHMDGRDVEDDAARRQRRRSENESSWAEMAEQTLAMMPRSPVERRRSSSSGSHSSPLRPLLPPSGRIEDINVFDDDDEEEDMRGPMPLGGAGEDARERGSMPVDEVELVYGE